MSAILLSPVPDFPPQVPASLQAIVRRCLNKEPGERYQQASEIKAALDAVGAAPIEAQAAAPPPSRRIIGAAITIAAALMAAAGLAYWRMAPTRSTAARTTRSIAVLPLTNLSGDPSQEFFADGMTEALITDLARVKGLDVISRTSVMQYKSAPKPLKDVARELSVDSIVEGSIIRDGGRVRITAQLIDGATDRHLWANEYDRDVRDVLSLQREVATAIAREVRATLAPSEAAAGGARRIDPEAYDLYLKGRALTFRYNEESIAEAIRVLTRALEIEPEFANAWAALASAHSERGIWGKTTSAETAVRAREAITRALALDPNQAEAYAVLANINTVYNWDWAAAERAVTRAVDLAPGDGRPHQYYAALLMALRRFPEAIVQAEAYRRLDPASPIAASNLARVLYRARRFDDAIATFQKAIELDPSYGPTYARLADVYVEQKRFDDALKTLDRGQQVFGRSRRQIDGYAFTYAVAGRRPEAEALVKELAARAESSDQETYSLAQVETALGRPDEAFKWLNRAFEQHSATLWLVNGELKFDPLRADPRFQDLLRRMNLPSAPVRTP
jgi:TolB-like protein/Tfp pilus assembly protein PilF